MRSMLAWAAVALAGSVVTSFPAPNLLLNGSFEALDEKGAPIGWHRYGKECDRVILTDDTTSFEGKRSAKFLPIVSGATDGPCWWQDVPCTPGQTYRVSGYFRSEDCIAGSLGLRLFWRNANRDWIWQNARASRTLTGTVGWTLLQAQGTAPPGAAWAAVELFGDTGQAVKGLAWCDEVKLQEMIAPTDWDQFKPDATVQALLPDFCWEYDRGVVACAYLEDAVRGLRRARCYGSGAKETRAPTRLEEALQKAWKTLLDLRDRYRSIYPLVHGKPGNGWPLAYAECKAAYHGDPDLGEELRGMTEAAKALVGEALATLRDCAKERDRRRPKSAIGNRQSAISSTWAVPDLTGRDPPTKDRLVMPNGRVDRILFGGSHCIPGDRWKHNRLMQYDYEMQIYENLDWPKRDQLKWSDGDILAPFAQHNIAIDMIVSYSNHGFMYCPQWLWPEIVKDQDAFITERAAPKPGAPWMRFPLLNFAHPKVREMQDEYIKVLGEHYKGSHDIVYYRGPWEANDAGPEWTHESARDRYSMQEFRTTLERRYRTIVALNAEWGTKYNGFADIQAPPRPSDQPNQSPSPLVYAFEAYRKDRFMNWWRHCYEAFKKADPTHPVATDPCAPGYNSNVSSAVDYYRLPEGGDIVSLHWGDTPAWMFWYLYSIGRLTAKPLGVLEYVWNGPECWGAPTDEVAAAAGQRNLWEGTALGVRMYNFYGHNDTYVSWPSTDQSSYNNLMDFETDYSLFRPCAGVVPLMHSKVNALRQIWFGTKIVAPQVAIYQPSTALNHPASGALVSEAAVAFEDLLYQHNLPHATLFEEAVLEGKDGFSNYRAVCLPCAVVLPKSVSNRLVAWVKGGGLLISAGPFGVWDTNVREDESAMRALLGDRLPRSSGSDEWTFRGGAPFVSTGAGKGHVLLTPDVHLRQNDAALEAIREEMLARIVRPVTCDSPNLAMIVREGRDGARYITVYNRRSDRGATGTLWVRGEWKRAVDLGIAGGWPLRPREEKGGVLLPVVFGPGEGTVIRAE